jgi:hypothetical protein
MKSTDKSGDVEHHRGQGPGFRSMSNLRTLPTAPSPTTTTLIVCILLERVLKRGELDLTGNVEKSN